MIHPVIVVIVNWITPHNGSIHFPEISSNITSRAIIGIQAFIAVVNTSLACPAIVISIVSWRTDIVADASCDHEIGGSLDTPVYFYYHIDELQILEAVVRGNLN